MFGSAFYEPHYFCLLGDPFLVWATITADASIAFAYFMIPLILLGIMKDLPRLPIRPIIVMFALFITFCGLTHVMEIVTMWWAAYDLGLLIKVLTAIFSIGTMVVITLDRHIIRGLVARMWHLE